MANEFRLPDIGEGLAEAEIVSWLVAVGDPVAADQNVVEVETDKAVVEIPTPYGGTVLHLGGAEGDVIQVGSVLLVVGDEDEVYPSSGGDAAPIVGSISEEAIHLPPTDRAQATPLETSRVKALPVVRKLARDLGIDLETVRGSGPDGKITREDVLAASGGSPEGAQPATTQAAPEVHTPAAHPAPAGVPGERVRMSRLRRTIAANMSRSWAEIPHVTTFDEVEVGRLLDARRALIARHGSAVSIDAMTAKAVIPALRAYPEFNATVDGDDLVLHQAIHLGVAVDTDEGLMVVVVRDADRLGLIELSSQIAELAAGAKDRTLPAEALAGQSFTLSNIGAVGGGFGTPIVPPGTTAILSVGKAVDRPVARDGAVAVAPVMSLSLSYDHRVIDGGVGRRFMAMVLENLAEPALFLVD